MKSQYRAALEATIEESDALIRTFNALLMIARAKSGQASDGMSEFDAAEVARGVGELYEPLADDKGLVLKVEAPATAPVCGNRELVSQALANLVDTPSSTPRPAPDTSTGRTGRSPKFVVKALARAGASAHRRRRGPGIPEADRCAWSERFVRLEQSRSQPGSGLGLSLAAAVARLHGGELKLEDNHPGLRSVLTLAARGASSGGGVKLYRGKSAPEVPYKSLDRCVQTGASRRRRRSL